jgi:hypothetical protein
MLMYIIDILELLVCFLLLFQTLYFKIKDYNLVVYCEIGSIPKDLLLGQRQVFLFSFLVVWLYNLVFNKHFIVNKN